MNYQLLSIIYYLLTIIYKMLLYKIFGNNIEDDLLFVLRLIQISICYS